LDNFNDATTNGGDYGDWVVHNPSQVQDFAGTPGTQPNLGVPEITNLDVIGYTLVPTAAVPEPGTFALMGAGILGLGLGGWRRRAGRAAPGVCFDGLRPRLGGGAGPLLAAVRPRRRRTPADALRRLWSLQAGGRGDLRRRQPPDRYVERQPPDHERHRPGRLR